MTRKKPLPRTIEKPQMSNFNFEKLEVSQATTWLDLPEVAPGARVCLKPATEANPAYFNAMMRRSAGRARKMIRTDRVTTEDTAANRLEDRELFPVFVFVTWEGIPDTENRPVPFNRDNVKEFCAKLPDWLFDRIRNHASTPERFLPEDVDPEPDTEDLAGN